MHMHNRFASARSRVRAFLSVAREKRAFLSVGAGGGPLQAQVFTVGRGMVLPPPLSSRSLPPSLHPTLSHACMNGRNGIKQQSRHLHVTVFGSQRKHGFKRLTDDTGTVTGTGTGTGARTYAGGAHLCQTCVAS